MATDSIEDVIQRLEHRKAEIETTIAVLRRELLGENVSIPDGPAPAVSRSESREVQDDSFLGMSVPAACRKYLNMVKRPQTTPEIAAALERGGVHSSAQNFTTSVYTALTRQADIVRVGKKWSLREWHPNLRHRSRANGSGDGDDSEATSTSDDA